MTTVTRHIACFCDSTFDAEIPVSGNLAGDPGLAELILDGSFMAVICPACGKRLTPEYPFRLCGVDRVGEVFLVPEADRAAFVRGTLDYPVGAPGRVAVGFPELMEKVLIFSRDLDDRVIECMKYYLLTGPSAAVPEGPETEVSIVYRGTEGEKHVFNLLGVRKGEVGVARLAAALYDRIAADIDSRVTREPFRQFCEPPWVSLRRAAEDRL
jgi:hypothetical protein